MSFIWFLFVDPYMMEDLSEDLAWPIFVIGNTFLFVQCRKGESRIQGS
jgi:hypothetical protein